MPTGHTISHYKKEADDMAGRGLAGMWVRGKEVIS